jgi:ectoine hydroxylase-related dioxygenase (phytanoyl-CoA dioxygenase family)
MQLLSTNCNSNHDGNRSLRALLGIVFLAVVVTKNDSIIVHAFSSPSAKSQAVSLLPAASRGQILDTNKRKSCASTATATNCLYQTVTNDVDIDTISSPSARMEEEMLSGPEQSFLLELEEPKRRKIWKQLEKAARYTSKKSNSKSTGSGFGGAGFGGKSKKPGAKGEKKTEPQASKDKQQQEQHLEFDLKQDKSRFGAVIVEQGVARINGCLSKETAASLLDFINGYLEEALTTKVEEKTLEEIYKQQPYFADVREKLNRWDVLLPLEESDMVQQAVWELLVENTVVSDSIESILGPSAQLYEMGSLISDPGSERQLLHADYNYQPDFQPDIPPALTCFVALQDIDESMGPTIFLPASATEEYHKEIAMGQNDEYGDGDHKSQLLSKSTNVLSTLHTGDCSLYNPMTLHCGGANRSDKRRVIFYFSFKNKKYDEKDWPLAYASLRPDLRARGLSLGEIQNIVTEHHKKGN